VSTLARPDQHRFICRPSPFLLASIDHLPFLPSSVFTHMPFSHHPPLSLSTFPPLSLPALSSSNPNANTTSTPSLAQTHNNVNRRSTLAAKLRTQVPIPPSLQQTSFLKNDASPYKRRSLETASPQGSVGRLAGTAMSAGKRGGMRSSGEGSSSKEGEGEGEEERGDHGCVRVERGGAAARGVVRETSSTSSSTASSFSTEEVLQEEEQDGPVAIVKAGTEGKGGRRKKEGRVVATAAVETGGTFSEKNTLGAHLMTGGLEGEICTSNPASLACVVTAASRD
jgi:hypothetical protein